MDGSLEEQKLDYTFGTTKREFSKGTVGWGKHVAKEQRCP